MQELELLTKTVASGSDLSFEQGCQAAGALAGIDSSLEAKKAFLMALAAKGESALEVAAFAETFRGLAVDPKVEKWASQAIDVCGTGGDGAGTFNISTAVSFIVAAGGVPVFKHGNRSITSKCGSADLLEAFEIDLEAPHEVLRESLEALNFCFFFAPAFHPAFKEIMPVRRSLAEQGQRTIFNLLGPLINPGRPAFQLLGVYAEHWVQPLAEALDALGLKDGFVAHGIPEAGVALDELSCAGNNVFAGLGASKSVGGSLRSIDGGLPSCTFSELSGGDVAENKKMMLSLVEGDFSHVSPGLRDSILLNAGMAFWACGRAVDLVEGVKVARDLLAHGEVADWLQRVAEFYKKHRK